MDLQHWKRFGFFILLATLGLTLNSFPTQIVLACSVPQPDSWFTELIQVQTGQLPEGVSIAYTTIPYPAHVINNTSATPLYILMEPPSFVSSFPEEVKGVPSGAAPLYKAVANQAFYWTTQNLAGANTTEFAWLPIERLEIYVRNNQIDTPTGTIMHLAQRNPNEPIRPKAVATPIPQQVQLLVIYGEQIRAVPLQIVYELNQAYRPEIGRGADPCQPTMVAPTITSTGSMVSNSYNWLLWIIATSAIGIVLIGVFMRRRHE
jgi:hypothetical protein